MIIICFIGVSISTHQHSYTGQFPFKKLKTAPIRIFISKIQQSMIDIIFSVRQEESFIEFFGNATYVTWSILSWKCEFFLH